LDINLLGALEVLAEPVEPKPVPGTGYFRMPEEHRDGMYKLEYAKSLFKN
jgi:hypothetical protein